MGRTPASPPSRLDIASPKPEDGWAISRRGFLAGLAGLAGAAAVGSLASACSAVGEPSPLPALTLGSNYADEIPRGAMRGVVDEFTARTGIEVSVNTVAPQAFQERIAAYLQATPEDVFTWFAGQRMRFFADQGLAGDVSDVWEAIEEHHTEAAKAASTATDGRQYLVPFITYPWVLIHRRSIWQERGYEPPATLDELITLAERMQSDGLVPFAFGNREGWPAMGTFDILDLRLNGYDFHIDLLEGRQGWRDDRVRQVLETWRELLPYHQAAALGRTWQEAAGSLMAGEAGMLFLATFAAEQATDEEREDLEIQPFPAMGTVHDAERAIDAPINGFMLSRSPAEPAAARAFLEFVGTAEAQNIYVASNPSRIAAALDADTSGYSSLQGQMAEVIAGAGRMAQFFDRDTRPDFAGPQGMQSFLQDFLHHPQQDLDGLLGRIQDFWDSLT